MPQIGVLWPNYCIITVAHKSSEHNFMRKPIFDYPRANNAFCRSEHLRILLLPHCTLSEHLLVFCSGSREKIVVFLRKLYFCGSEDSKMLFRQMAPSP